jgi:hypothetical protein
MSSNFETFLTNSLEFESAEKKRSLLGLVLDFDLKVEDLDRSKQIKPSKLLF